MLLVAILAGGIGSRMKNELPKQFLEINGKPILIRTLENFMSNKQISKIYLGINVEWIDYYENLLSKWGISRDNVTFVNGGGTRFLSMYNIIKTAFNDGFATKDIIIQDCARPFVPKEVIDDLIEKRKHFDMVTACVPAIETIIVSEEASVVNDMPPRPTTLLNQGPQIFNVGEALEMIDSLTDDERQNFIEAGIMYFKKNKKIGISKGSEYSFKITTSFDLKLASVIAKELDEKRL